MKRAGYVAAVVLVCVVLVSLVVSCENPDPVLSLSVENQKILIAEMYAAFQYGEEPGTEKTLATEHKITLVYVLGEKVEPENDIDFSSAKYIKNGAQITLYITSEKIEENVIRYEVKVQATGSAVIGEWVLLELVLEEDATDLGLRSVTLNGKKIPTSGWPGDFPPPLPELEEAVLLRPPSHNLESLYPPIFVLWNE